MHSTRRAQVKGPELLRDNSLAAERDSYVDELIELGSSICLPELCSAPASNGVYRVRDRGGVDVVAIPAPALSARQLDALSRFRFAQYLAAGFIDRDVAFGEGMDHDVLADGDGQPGADTLHFIALDSSSGLLLASMCLFALPGNGVHVRMSSRDRPPFPVEEHFGRGVFQRLALLPDTPIERVREFRRLVKNPRHVSVGAGPRAVIELCMAATRMLLGPLSTSVDVCIGEFETNGVRRNLEFFHTPMVVLAGGLPVFAPGHPLNAALDGRDRHPFAFLVTDLASMESRLDAIEEALAQPDPHGLAALAALKRVPYSTPSALVPASGIPTLCNTPLPQSSTSLTERRRARELGRRLRAFSPFAGLSDTECTTLRMLAQESQFAAGELVLERGRVADALVLIETGVAELCVRGLAREPIAGPGGCIGASGLLAGAASRGDVVAKTSMKVLRLPANTSLPLLLELPDAERELHRIALMELGRGGPESGRRSRLATNSAEAMAALRAAGSVDRRPELRNPDDLAASMLSLQLRAHALAKLPGTRRLVPALAERLLPGGYYYETARVKHIDAILRSELGDGLEQLVLLGAGYDTRPYRFAHELQDVRAYEVDLPALSEVKRRKVTRLLGGTPDNVTFVHADFAGDDVALKLGQAGYDLAGQTLIILSGVTPYLAEPAVARLLDFAGRHTCPRSSLVFDYVFREMVEGDDSFHGAASTRKRLEKLGEPLRFGLPAGCVERYVERFGLALVSDLQPTELARRYLCATDGTVQGEPYGFAAIAHTRVCPDGRRRT